MKAINNNGTIKVEASYTEMAAIVQVLEDFAVKNEDEFVKELAAQLRCPAVEI